MRSKNLLFSCRYAFQFRSYAIFFSGGDVCRDGPEGLHFDQGFADRLGSIQRHFQRENREPSEKLPGDFGDLEELDVPVERVAGAARDDGQNPGIGNRLRHDEGQHRSVALAHDRDGPGPDAVEVRPLADP